MNVNGEVHVQTVQLDVQYLGANRAPFPVEDTGPSEFLGASGQWAPCYFDPCQSRLTQCQR